MRPAEGGADIDPSRYRSIRSSVSSIERPARRRPRPPPPRAKLLRGGCSRHGLAELADYKFVAHDRPGDLQGVIADTGVNDKTPVHPVDHAP